MSTFIPYQIDYSVQNTAKTIGFSKKRITFKFGFADHESIYGTTTTVVPKMGSDCRGSEHEVILIWSLTSGKRQLYVNNKEIHYSVSHQNGWTKDTSWQHIFPLIDPNTPNHKYRVHIIIQPNNNSNNTGTTTSQYHPFDLKINNLSYFNFNPIYQLGTPRMIVGQQIQSSSHTTNRGGYHRMDSPMTHEERQQLAQAKLASLQDIAQQQKQQSSQAVVGTEGKEAALPTVVQQHQQQDDLLISFDDEDQKDLVGNTTVSPSMEQSMTGSWNTIPNVVGPPNQIVPTHNSSHMYASSITFDQHYPLVQGNSSATFEYNNNDTNRQQPGSYYNKNTNNNTSNSNTNTNPYASSTQPSYITTNPYTANIDPYDQNTTSTALTPYQPPTTTTTTGSIPPSSNPYTQYYPPTTTTTSTINVSTNSTYAPPPFTSTSNYAPPPPVITTSPYYSNNLTMTTTGTDIPLSSPSATTVYTYGSAPSFAQPPKPPAPASSNNMSSYYDPSNHVATTTNPYGSTIPISYSTSPYGAPPTTTTSSSSTGMYQPPPQQYTSTPYQY